MKISINNFKLDILIKGKNNNNIWIMVINNFRINISIWIKFKVVRVIYSNNNNINNNLFNRKNKIN